MAEKFLDSHRRHSICTTEGTEFDFLNPDPEIITLNSIAEGLSKASRYAGQTPGVFYCVVPETKILTYDLRWVSAGDLTTGDDLLAFDEESFGHRDLRKWKRSTANVHGEVERTLYKVCLSDGTEITCSEEHPLLTASSQGNNYIWKTAKELYEDVTLGVKNKYMRGRKQVKRYLPKFVNMWQEDTSKSAGWLEGMFDGEGTTSSKASRGSSLSIAQNPGPILDRLKAELSVRGFDLHESLTKQCRNLVIKGGASEQLRLLGSIRSERLRDTLLERLVGTGITRKGDKVEVISVECIGKGKVVALETSTNTYITEGFGSHNSVAEHSVLCSYRVSEQNALQALMHDAAEAYTGDFANPLKRLIHDQTDILKVIDDRITRAIFQKFGIEPSSDADAICEEVHEADTYVFFQERNQLMPVALWWDNYGGGDIDYPEIRCYEWRMAKNIFIKRFEELFYGTQVSKTRG